MGERMASKQLQNQTSINIPELLDSLTDRFAERIGNGGSKLDTRLSRMEDIQTGIKEDIVSLKVSTGILTDSVKDIRSDIGSLNVQVTQVAKKADEPCPFHAGISSAASTVPMVTKDVAVIQSEYLGLCRRIDTFMGVVDVTRKQDQENHEQTQKQLTDIQKDVESLKRGDRDNSKIVTYFIMGAVGIVFSILGTLTTLHFTNNTQSNPPSIGAKP